MNVLVSGSTGTVGRALLKRSGDFATISLRYGVDLDDRQREKLAQCDAFIHCGALLEGSFRDMFQSNTLLVSQLLEYFSSENPDAHLIILSTMSLLEPSAHVSHDDYLEFRLMTDYAASKYLAEVVCSRYSIPITVLRFSTLFCRDPRKDGLSKLVHDAVLDGRVTLLNDGRAKRDFLPLEVAARYVTAVIGKEEFYGRHMNIVSGQAVSFRQMVDYIRPKLNRLVVENKTVTEARSVPAEFSTEDIQRIGRIEFSVYHEVDSYIQELQANT
jgi:nucleoside-diphosphate-sugar epimerase